MGTVGRSTVIPLAINTKYLACLTLKCELADPYFIANAFQIHPGSFAQIHMDPKRAIIKCLKLRLPPLDLQQSFAAFVPDIDRSGSVYGCPCIIRSYDRSLDTL